MISLIEAWAVCRRLDEAANTVLDRSVVAAIALEQPTITPAEAGMRTKQSKR